MDYGAGKDICICKRTLDGHLVDDERPYWEAMPLMRPGRYADMDDKWDLEEDFYLRIRDRVLWIKKGFDLDGASIPKWFWNKIGHPLEMWILLAALPHDGWFASNTVPFKEANWLFLEILHACDRATPSDRKWMLTRASEDFWQWRRRNYCYTAVQGFGKNVYKKTEADIRKYKALVEMIELKPMEGLLT